MDAFAAGLPPWEEIERGGHIDVNRLVASPAIRMGARMMGAALPATLPANTRIPSGSPLAEQLRAQYDRTALLIQHMGAQPSVDLERLRPKPGECPSLEPRPAETPADLRKRLRFAIAGKRSQRTAAHTKH